MDRKARVTRKDVAQKAGVSVATVSYVLNHTKTVSEEVEARVKEAARELRYQPNLIARSLITKRSMHVAILVDNLNNPYYIKLLEGAQKLAAKKGYIVALMLQDHLNSENLDQLVSRQIDGLVVTTQKWKGIYERIGSLIPCIGPQDYSNKLLIDYRHAMFEAVKTIKRYGHRRVAAICGLEQGTDDPRICNLKEALENEGMEVDQELFIWGDKDSETTVTKGYQAMDQLLKRGREFTAVFAMNDLMAIGAMRCLREHTLRIPEDISLWGCDNDDRDEDLQIPLSSIDVAPKSIGEELMRMLLAEIEGSQVTEKTIRGVFVERKSIGVCKH